jgi:hypothetical protein
VCVDKKYSRSLDECVDERMKVTEYRVSYDRLQCRTAPAIIRNRNIQGTLVHRNHDVIYNLAHINECAELQVVALKLVAYYL